MSNRSITVNVPPENILHGELEALIITSIQTLECNYKKYGRYEVFQLVNISLEKKFQGRFLKIVYTS